MWNITWVKEKFKKPIKYILEKLWLVVPDQIIINKIIIQNLNIILHLGWDIEKLFVNDILKEGIQRKYIERNDIEERLTEKSILLKEELVFQIN